MKQTIEAFEKRNVPAFYHSLSPQAKRDRWERREQKINERKNSAGDRNSVSLNDKIRDSENLQPSLFD